MEKFRFFALIFLCINLYSLNADSSQFTNQDTKDICEGTNVEFREKDIEISSFANRVFKILKKSWNKEQLRSLYKDKDTNGYIKKLVPSFIMQLIGFVFSLVLFIALILTFCCRMCCEQNTYVSAQKGCKVWCPIIFFLVASGISIGCTIFVFKENVALVDNTSDVFCTISGIGDYFDNGYTNTEVNANWLGISKTQSTINNIEETMDQRIANLEDSFSESTTQIKADKDHLKDEITGIYTNNKDSKVANPDPITGGEIVLPVTASLGPVDDSSKTLYAFDQELTTITNSTVTLYDSLQTKIQDLDNESEKVKGHLQDAYSSLEDLSSGFTKYNDKVNKVAKQQNKNKKSVEVGIKCICAFLLSIAVIGIICFIVAIKLKIRWLRIFLHITWVLLNLFIILGFAVSAILVPLSIISYQGCMEMDYMFSSEEAYSSNDIAEFIPSGEDILPQLKTCFFGDGDLGAQFQIRENLDEFNNIKSELKKFEDINVETIIENRVSKNAKELINEQITDPGKAYPTVNTTLSSFVKYTDKTVSSSELASCNGNPQNEWVFNYDNCNYAEKYEGHAQPTYRFGEPICLKIDDFTTADYTQRANQYNQAIGCSNHNADIHLTGSATLVASNERFHQSLLNFQNDINTELGQLQTDVTNYDDEYVPYLNKLKSLVETSSADIQTETDGFLNDILGFSDKLNCKFVKYGVNSFRQNFCYEIVPEIYYLGVLLCVICFCGIFQVICSYLIARRVYKMALNDENRNNREDSLQQLIEVQDLHEE